MTTSTVQTPLYFYRGRDSSHATKLAWGFVEVLGESFFEESDRRWELKLQQDMERVGLSKKRLAVHAAVKLVPVVGQAVPGVAGGVIRACGVLADGLEDLIVKTKELPDIYQDLIEKGVTVVDTTRELLPCLQRIQHEGESYRTLIRCLYRSNVVLGILIDLLEKVKEKTWVQRLRGTLLRTDKERCVKLDRRLDDILRMFDLAIKVRTFLNSEIWREEERGSRDTDT
jgi:hypothetical protein